LEENAASIFQVEESSTLKLEVCVPLKCQKLSTSLCNITYQKIVIFIITAIEPSNLVYLCGNHSSLPNTGRKYVKITSILFILFG
jgi:hypothetical protein